MSNGQPATPDGGRVPLARSFAFRLGAAFAVVAIASAGITALVVNAPLRKTHPLPVRGALGFQHRVVAGDQPFAG